MAGFDLDELARATGLPVTRDAPLAPLTSLKVGGPARVLVRARRGEDVAQAVSFASARGVPHLVVGGGSNLVAADEGFDGLVVKVDPPLGSRAAGTVAACDGDDVLVDVEAGCLTAGLARWAAREGLGGLEWSCGIPGTVGGAISGNAGAYGGEMRGVVHSVRAWACDATPVDGTTGAGGVIDVPGDAMAFGYRTSRFKRSGRGAVLGARLRLRREDPRVLLARIDEYEAERRRKQPTERSCGSVFRNPPGDVAGRLLERAGMKGRARGDAQVSGLHANWILNRGRASAADVVALMREGQAAVRASAGILLRLEVLLVGPWSADDVGDLVAPTSASEDRVQAGASDVPGSRP